MSAPEDLVALADWLDRAEDADADCARRAALDPGLVAEARGQLRLHLLLRSQFGGPNAATVARIARELAEGPDTRRIRARRIAQRVRHRPAPLWRWALATAALLALVIGGVGSVPRLQRIGWVEDGHVVLRRGGETTGFDSRRLRAGDTLEALELSRLRFNDGTVLTIDAGTRLELLAGQSLLDGAAKRLALSTGGLQAEVAKQPAGSPLTITTPEAELTVVGTAFLLARQAETTRLLVSEGRVRMSAAGSMREIAAGGSQHCDRNGFSPPAPLRDWPLASAADIAIPPPPTGPRLRELAGSTLIGSAFFANWYTAADRTIVLREHNAVQAVCYGAYGAWSAPGVYDFADFNRTINWAVANDKQVIMQVLVGNDTFLPTWLRNGRYTGPQLEALMDAFIKAIITSNGNAGKVAMWNVVNEVCNLDGNGFEPSVLDALGWEDDASGLTGDEQQVRRIPVYIRRAFEIARKYTGRDLELRDHSIEMHMTGHIPNTFKPKLFYQLCRHLLAKGAPLTAVGIQGHVTVEPTWSPNTWADHAAWIRKLKALGLKVFITEGSVQPAHLPLAADWDGYQRGKVHDMLKAEREAGVDGFFTWGLRCDADPSGFHQGMNSLPFTRNGAARPFYYGLQQALAETLPPTQTRCAEPEITLAPGPCLRLTCPIPGARIRFTIDGSLPGPDAPLYLAPLRLAVPVTVRARAEVAGLTPSEAVEHTLAP